MDKENYKERFFGQPELQRVFEQYDKQLKRYYVYEWSEGTTREKLCEKRTSL